MTKISLLTLATFGCLLSVRAQTTSVASPVIFAKVDASPLDLVYFPLNTSKAKDGVAPVMRVLYSRPQKKGREIFGVLEQFGKLWRLGANESTEIEFFKTVRVNNKKIKAGRYSLFAIPNKDKWTFIINKQTDKWGAFTYNEKEDVIRVDVPISKLDKPIDTFSISFVANADGAHLVVAWDTTQAALPINFSK